MQRVDFLLRSFRGVASGGRKPPDNSQNQGTDAPRSPAQRSGFTLVEMLVVLSIILTLSVLTVLFMPRIQEQQRVRQGADLLQSWLLMAKQRALRDRVPTGIRIQSSAPNAIVQDLQYVQKPDDYTQGGISLWRGTKVTFVGVDLKGPAGDTVQPGDYLLVRGEGLPSLISSVDSPTTLTVASVIHAYPPQPGTLCSYQIIRQPRPLAGEQPLQLPQDVMIDLSAGKSLNVPPRAPFAGEILFAPSGMVIGQGTGGAPIALWLRDVSRDANQPGEQILMVVYPRTGQIAAQAVAPGTDPYQFLKDGRSSGF